nr:MAG TPA: hypothetical protein [Crassvirales sp.]
MPILINSSFIQSSIRFYSFHSFIILVSTKGEIIHSLKSG